MGVNPDGGLTTGATAAINDGGASWGARGLNLTSAQGIAASPPAAQVFTFSDPEAYALATVNLAGGAVAPRFVGAIGGTFHAKIARVGLDRLGLGLGHASVPVSFTAGIPNSHVFVFATGPAAARRISGWTVDGQHIFHHRPNEQAFATSPSGQPWPYAAVVAPFDLMAVQGPDVTGLDPKVPLNDDRLFLAPKAALARLVALMRDAARIAEESPWVIASPESAKALAGAITEALLVCLTQGQASRDRAALRRHRQIVTRFEQVMLERPAEMLSMPDICAALGVARRTLNLACLEFLGQGATQYARARRLDHVRETLLNADPGTTQVTRVALGYGFWELGRFAQAYRRRFGERPSDTLHHNRARSLGRMELDAFHAQIA
jgi:AraC-like DNA-binding protein